MHRLSHLRSGVCRVASGRHLNRRLYAPHSGVKGDAFTTAVGCHQCEDAPCANVCPTQAIRRGEGAWQVEQARCIGCKRCMVACPFGAMQVQWAGDTLQALKCDLCAHRADGPACVEACPTHALSCVDPARLRTERLRHLA